MPGTRGATPHWMSRRLLTAVVLLLVAVRVAAQPAPPILDGAFKIGYLAHGSDLEGTEPQSMREMMEGLRETLMNSPKVAGAMRQFSIDDIQMRRCEDPFDMLQRLRASEFDAAFATAVVYARLLHPEPGAPRPSGQVNYVPILQSRHFDDLPQPDQTGFHRRASIIIGPGSDLWERRDISMEGIMPELARGMAVGDYYSAANCVWPMIRLRSLFPAARPPSLVFCRSSREAFKHVASGLLPGGACESRLLTRPDPAAPVLVREVMRTEPFPTDPVIMRPELLPGAFPVRVGTEVREAIRDYFNATSQPPAPGFTMEQVGREPYDAMSGPLARFDELFARR